MEEQVKPHILATTNWKAINTTDYQVAVLPWGATEAHNYHLPYGTDVIIAEKMSEEAARIANLKGAKVIVLPTIPFGVNTGQSDVLLDMNLNPSTQFAILRDLITVLNRQGIHKLVILNTHGGNDFKQMIRELNLLFPEMFICQCNTFKITGIDDFVELSGEHAGESETSVMLYLTPELVRPLSEAGEGKAKVFTINALREGWAWAERKWTQVTQDTGIGNPERSTKEKGEQIFRLSTEKIASFLTDLGNTTTKDLYI
ncbi:MAG: creatininase family protein [Bacteroidetes bacterium]|nr:creatininase family protein [Bacteroidota bacterium]